MMRAFLLAHLFLTPFTTFTIAAGLGYPLAGAIIGLAVGVVFSAIKYGVATPSVFMIGQLIGLVAVLLAVLVDSDIAEHAVLAIAFGCIAAGALISVVQRKPWTAELSAGEYGDFAHSEPFIRANMLFSTMWVVVFGWFAVASWFELTPVLRWIPLVIAGVISVFGPRALMRLGARRGLFDAPASH